MQALALTDRNNMYGTVHFYIQAQKAGIKPLLGMEVDLEDGSCMVLLARNFDGYRNLCHLSSAPCMSTEPDVFPPAGFYDEGEEEIAPWESGVWGAPLFGFTPKPTPKASKLAASTPLTNPTSSTS